MSWLKTMAQQPGRGQLQQLKYFWGHSLHHRCWHPIGQRKSHSQLRVRVEGVCKGLWQKAWKQREVENWGYFYNLAHLVPKDELKWRTKPNAGSEKWDREVSDWVSEKVSCWRSEADTHCHITDAITAIAFTWNIEDALSHVSLTLNMSFVPWVSQPGLLSLLPVSQQPQWPQLSSYPSVAHDSSSWWMGKKTQKMGRLEPLIIVGLQLQLDTKLHLLVIGNLHSIWQAPQCPLTIPLFIV